MIPCGPRISDADISTKPCAMQDHVRRTSKFCAWVAAAVFALGFINAWSAAIGFFLLVFGVPVLLIGLVAASIVLIFRGLKLAILNENIYRRASVALAAPTILATLILTAWPILATGSFTGSLSMLAVNWSRYQAIIELARHDTRSPESGSIIPEAFGIRYLVDGGPPVRVAFHPEGFLDNWSGIIFDPTHDVMLADGIENGSFKGPERVTRLFGGDLLGCRHLWGDFFDCSFT